ncbi:MAG: hypothetical protein MHM6MM_001901 [Cercozoa sp. M6MM]
MNSSAEPEVHIFGELLGAARLGVGDAFCRFRFVQENDGASEAWRCAEGTLSGQTQVEQGSRGHVVWNHPVDVHFFARSVAGWPRIDVSVWRLTPEGHQVPVGYGTCAVPTTNGLHGIQCSLWRPVGSLSDELSRIFLGFAPSLRKPAAVSQDLELRQRLKTASAGTVLLRLEVLTRNFPQHNVEIAEKHTIMM